LHIPLSKGTHLFTWQTARWTGTGCYYGAKYNSTISVCKLWYMQKN